MPKVEAKILKQRVGGKFKELIQSFRVDDPTSQKISADWVKSIIRTHFPEFVMSGGLILISKTNDGFTAMRSCDPPTPQDEIHYIWQFLEIVPIKNKRK